MGDPEGGDASTAAYNANLWRCWMCCGGGIDRLHHELARGVGDSMMKGDFLTSGLNNLMDRVPLLKWRKGKCGSQGSLGEHNNPMNNRYCYFFYIMDEKLES